jgi:hypothetical protein
VCWALSWCRQPYPRTRTRSLLTPRNVKRRQVMIQLWYFLGSRICNSRILLSPAQLTHYDSAISNNKPVLMAGLGMFTVLLSQTRCCSRAFGCSGGNAIRPDFAHDPTKPNPRNAQNNSHSTNKRSKSLHQSPNIEISKVL